MSDSISLSSIAQRNEEIVEASIDGETVMMSIDSGLYYGLDNIASRIWQILENPTPVSTICQQLIEEYDVEEQQCQQDVLAFLGNLEENNIIMFA